MAPARFDILASTLRIVSPLKPATVPSFTSMSKSTFFSLLLLSSLELPDITDFRKPRPSNTSPRMVPRTTPS